MSSLKQMIRKAIYDDHRAAEQQFYNQKESNVKISNQLEMNPHLPISLHMHTHTSFRFRVLRK